MGELVFQPKKEAATNLIACLIGNPKFDLTGPETATASVENNFRSALIDEIWADTTARLRQLPATQTEVDGIEKLLADQQFSTQKWTGSAATEVNLRTAKSPRLLHIATHGHFLRSPKRERLLFNEQVAAENPMLRSMLFFAGANNTIRQKQLPDAFGDGVFTAFEASNLDLRGTELVVLSACGTGLGVIESGEGVFGLQRAFRAAGARFVMTSLWEVDDAQTQQFMQVFYENWLKNGLSIPAAFQKTQSGLREKGMAARHWGAFVLVGN